MELAWLAGIAVFLLVVMISVTLHEAGHMTAARLLGVKVPRFFAGFGKTVWSTKRGGTEYGVKALPLGGFVELEDDRQPEGSTERSTLSYVTPWKRVIIFAAGPAVNIALGLGIVFAFFALVPLPLVTGEVASVNACSVTPGNCQAEKAGLRAGDVILAADGVTAEDGKSYREALADGAAVLTVRRGEQYLPIRVTANADGLIGISRKTVTKAAGASLAAEATGQLLYRNLSAVATLPGKIPNVVRSITGEEQRDPQGVSSIVGAGRAYGDTASADIAGDGKAKSLVLYSGLLNVGLGLANLLPFMPLDGGRIIIALTDSVKMRIARLRRKAYVPTGTDLMSAMTVVGGVLLIGFTALVVTADLVAPLTLR